MKNRVIATLLALSCTLLASSAQAIYHRDNRILDVDTLLPLSDTSTQLRLAVSNGNAGIHGDGYQVTQNVSMEAVNGNAVLAN